MTIIVAIGYASILASCASRGELVDDAPEDGGAPPIAEDAEGGGSADAEISCDLQDWCSVATNLSSSFTLTALWGSGSDDVWAVGSGGSALHWDGAGWARVATDKTDTLHAVWGSGPKDVWAVGSTRTIFHGEGIASGKLSLVPEMSHDEGVMPTRLLAVGGTGPSDVNVAGERHAQGNAWSMTRRDGVVGWTPTSVWPEHPALIVRGMSFGEGEMWILGDEIHATPPVHGVVLRVRRTDPPTVTPVELPTEAQLRAMWRSASGHVWVVGDRGTILRLAPGEERFTRVDVPVVVDLHGVFGTAPDDIWAVGDRATAIHFDGSRWSMSTVALSRASAVDLRAVWASGSNDVWAIGSAVALHFTGFHGARP